MEGGVHPSRNTVGYCFEARWPISCQPYVDRHGSPVFLSFSLFLSIHTPSHFPSSLYRQVTCTQHTRARIRRTNHACRRQAFTMGNGDPEARFVCCANNGRVSRSASWPWLDKKYCLTADQPSLPSFFSLMARPLEIQPREQRRTSSRTWRCHANRVQVHETLGSLHEIGGRSNVDSSSRKFCYRSTGVSIGACITFLDLG